MPQDDRLKTLLQAQQMDNAIQEGVELDQEEQRARFLDIIGQIESSGGQNFSHRPMTSGIHKGTSAIGTYGLMPNTIKEIATRERRADNLPDDMAIAAQMDPQAMKQYLESNPHLERQFAESLAEKVLSKQNDEEKAAYSWLYGHNLDPQEIEKRGYQDEDYVQKYRKLRKLLGK